MAVNCQAGSPGGLGGEFGYPQAVGSDAAGNVYVLSSRIDKFAADPLPPTPPPAAAGSPAPTGKRAAALKKCKKTYKKNHDKKKFKNCKKKANQLPV